MYFFR